MNGPLIQSQKLTTVQAAVAAGSTDVATGEVDMAGFEGVQFLAQVVPASSVSTVSMYAQSAASTTSTFIAIDGSSAVWAAGPVSRTNTLITDVYKPVDRYVRAYVTRGTSNTALGGVSAIRYGSKKTPCTATSSDTAVAYTISASSS